MATLTAHIEALNAKTQEWIDAAPGRFGGMMETDAAYWAEVGIYTAAQFDRYMDEECYSDQYKSVYGVRPRHMADMTDAQLRAAIERMDAEVEASIKRDEEMDAYYAKLEAEEKAARAEQRAFDVAILNEADRIDAMLNPAPLAWEAEAMEFGG